MDPAFFTVRTPRARTHQQQLACIHHVFMTMMQQVLECVLEYTAVREVRNENHEIPEKGSNPEKGSIPKMDLTFFSLLEVLTGYCKMLLSTVLK